MATASVSLASTSGAKGNYEVGKGYFGYNGSFSTCYATYKFTLTAPTSSLSFSLSVDVLGSSQTYGYLIDTSSTNTGSFTQQGTFTGAAGNSSGFKAQTYSFTATGSFTAQTYYLHMKCNTSNAGYFHLTSGTVTYSPTTYTVSYNANGGTGAPSAQTKTHGTALTLSSTKPTKASTTATGYTVTFNGNGGTPSKTSASATNTTSYTFSKWNTKADGSGTSYNAGGSYTANAAATLYAQYTSSTTKGSVTTATASRSNGSASRTVTINANGGSSTVTSRKSTATITYACSGWYTASSGGSKRASAGAAYTPAATETVYAQWTATTGTYSAVTLPTAAQCTRAGFSLLGFATSSTAASAAYAPGASYTPASNVTLYAVWQAAGLVYIDLGNGFEPYQVFIDNGSGWNQYAPHIDNGSTFVLYS